MRKPFLYAILSHLLLQTSCSTVPMEVPEIEEYRVSFEFQEIEIQAIAEIEGDQMIIFIIPKGPNVWTIASSRDLCKFFCQKSRKWKRVELCGELKGVEGQFEIRTPKGNCTSRDYKELRKSREASSFAINVLHIGNKLILEQRKERQSKK